MCICQHFYNLGQLIERYFPLKKAIAEQNDRHRFLERRTPGLKKTHI